MSARLVGTIRYFGLSRRAGDFRLVLGRFFHTRLQGTNTLSYTFAQLRQFLRTKNQLINEEDHQQLHGLK